MKTDKEKVDILQYDVWYHLFLEEASCATWSFKALNCCTCML